ncbi:MAG TPA: DNA cytosine methyltransferase [Candidatus Acidoferrum sp.]|nr:DNA cytosine methyltransferase [Candidatus Acidoferrum sp.]
MTLDFIKREGTIDDQMKPKLFSFFSGAGFLDFGFESESYPVVFVNELSSDFLSAYKHARSKLGIRPPEFGYHNDSIMEFRKPEAEKSLREKMRLARKGGNLIGFVGGPPCPDFSIGGKNRGCRGDHGKLSRSYVELICHHRPDFFLFENVKGLWSTRRHRRFYDQLKAELIQSGYKLTDRLINCIQYGTPQDRERIILLGFRTGALRQAGESRYADNLPFPWDTRALFPGRQAFSYEWPKTAAFREEADLIAPSNIPLHLTVESWFRRNEVWNHPNAGHCFKPRAGFRKFMTVAEGDDSKKSFKRLHRWRYSPTACYGNNEVHLHPYRPRRINVAEALAIQSLPKEFELPPYLSLSAMFKIVGNGVPFLAARMIARSLLDFLKEPYGTHEADSNQHRSSNWETSYQACLQLY